jgi:shikimate dehydrogenase
MSLPSRRITGGITKDTTVCISLSGRPSNIGTRFHNYLYDELGLDYVYKAFTTTDIAAAIAGVRGLGIRGAAISMPWKEEVIPLVDRLEPSAAAISSVNTIVNSDGRLTAYNTDYLAVASLLASHQVPSSARTFILGSGGMAKAATAALRDGGFRHTTVVARNPDTGRALADEYGFGWVSSADRHAGPDVIINATPVGMSGGPQEHDLPVEDDLVRSAAVVFDVVAAPSQTPLIRRAQELDKQVITGAEVIALQAVEQFELYTGVRPSRDQIDRASEFSRQPAGYRDD